MKSKSFPSPPVSFVLLYVFIFLSACVSVCPHVGACARGPWVRTGLSVPGRSQWIAGTANYRLENNDVNRAVQKVEQVQQDKEDKDCLGARRVGVDALPLC